MAGDGGNKSILGRSGYDLLADLQSSGCPICSFVEREAAKYLDRISYDSVNDLRVRDELRKAIGYCAVHGQEWQRLHNTLGTAIIYNDVLTNVRRALAPYASGTSENAGGGLLGRLQGLRGTGAGKALADALTPSVPCPACKNVEIITADGVGAFAGALNNAEFVAAYRQHPAGLCVPHLREVLRVINDPALVLLVVEVQDKALAATTTALAEVIRKYDYRFQHEERGEEFTIPARAVEQAAGRLPTQLNPPKSQR